MVRQLGIASTSILLVTLFTACGDSDSGSRTPSAPTPSEDEYNSYLTEAGNLGGDVINKEDAAIRAMLLCTGDPAEMLGGVSIDNFPTDLALVRAYCPDKEDNYR
jgi:hypothetical protein